MATPQRRQAAILYVEMRNFTRLSEALEAGKVLQLVNEFLSLAGKVVAANGGKAAAVHNDSLLAIFTGADAKQVSASALKAAQDIEREFKPVGERWKTEYGLAAVVSAGLHLGEAVFGMVEAPGTQQFLAFGDCISIAERILHRARAGEIVISLELMKGLGPLVKGLNATELPALELGKRPPIPIYGMTVEDRLDFT